MAKGAVLLLILDTVSVGHQYVIGFNSASESSVIYVQSTRNGVLDCE